MDKTEQIRARAHELWEAEGRPEGRHDAHWEQAQAELMQSDPMSQDRVAGELPDIETTSDAPQGDHGAPDGPASGHVIEAGEGGTTLAPDEAQEAIEHPLDGSARGGPDSTQI